MQQHLKKNIKIYYNKTLPYDTYQKLADYFRIKRWENIIFCDHYPVITAGIQYKEESFKFPKDWIEKQNVKIFYTQRGGDLTAHELNQIIIYPHIDLKKRQIKLTDFLNQIIFLTKNIIEDKFSVRLNYHSEMPGLYDLAGNKIVSIGLEIKKGFTSSGLAINYTNDLKTFTYIFPCGFRFLKMNSIKNLVSEQFNDKKNDFDFNKKKIEFCKQWSDLFLQYLQSF